MKFFFIFRVELIFYCYICPQIEVEDRLHLENENKSCFILHFAQFALSLHSEECEVWRRLSNWKTFHCVRLAQTLSSKVNGNAFQWRIWTSFIMACHPATRRLL